MEDMDKIVTEVEREAEKEFLENLMNTERDVFLMENNGQKNGYYSRSMKTRMGEINNLNVPRDREGSFQTAAFEPYSRSIGIDEIILALYSKGISTRNSAEIMQTIFQNRYSKSTISAITEATLEEVKRFQERSLNSRYIAIFLDGLFFFLRRYTVEKEPVIFAMGIKETGDYSESDRNEIERDLKGIFLSDTKDSAISRFNHFRDKWSSKYQKPVYNMEKKLGYLFTYFQYPCSIRRSLHSSNIIERMNKEIRRRIKVIDTLPSESTAMKIIYLRVA